MQLSHIRQSIGPSILAVGLMVSIASHAEVPTTVQVDQHRTEAGHEFHYVGIKQADDVAIIVNWPSDWIDGDGPIATPYVGSRLMMSSGAGARDAATLAADFQDLNAQGDIDDRPDAVRGTLVVRPENLAAAAALGRDILIDNHWDDRWLKRIQQNLKARKNETHQTLSSQSWGTVRRAILGDGRLNDALTHRPTSLIDEVTADDIRAWYAETFTTGGITITAAGPIDLDPALVGEAIDQLLDGLPAGDGPSEALPAQETPTAKSGGKTILLHKPDAEKTLISIAGLMPLARGASHAHDLFAEFVLGADMQSRLFDAVRTKLRASYVVEAEIGGYSRQHRIMYLDGEIEGRRIKDAYATFREAYETLRADGITPDEFERAKEILTAHYQEIAKQPETMAWLLLGFLIDDDPMKDSLAEMPELIGVVTLDQVNAAIRDRLPAFDDMVRVVTAPNDDAVEPHCVITSVADVDRC